MRVLLLRFKLWKVRNIVKRELRDCRGKRGLCAIITDHEYRRYRPLLRNFCDFLQEVMASNSKYSYESMYKIDSKIMLELNRMEFRLRARHWLCRRSVYVFPIDEEHIKHRERLFELFCQNEILRAKRGVK